MKKGVVLIILSFILAIPAMGQTRLVKSVERMAKKDKADLVEARKLIEPALTNPETMNDPHAWYVAGLIEEKVVDKGYLAMQLGQEVDENAFYDSLMDMIKFYKKTNELDSRKKYEKKINPPISTYYQLLVNAGAAHLEKNEFPEAHKYFQAFLDVKKMDLFKGTPVADIDSLSMQIGFFNAYALSQIENNSENAIAAYESIKNIDFRRSDVYQLLAIQYLYAKNNDNYIKTLKEGAQLFPDQTFFLSNLVDAYIKQNELDEAKNYLDLAIAENPNNVDMLYVYGFLYENGYQDLEKAKEYYLKTTEIDPTYSLGYYGIGRTYFNIGSNIRNNADISDQVKYNEAISNSDKLFKEAIPYFKKAIELEPDNKDYLSAISNCYYVLGMEEERIKIEEKIATL